MLTGWFSAGACIVDGQSDPHGKGFAMRAARYYGKEDIRIEEIDEPHVRPGTVKIRPAFNGICGSDLQLYFDGPIPPAPSDTQPHPISGETLPVTFGHEFSGVIEEIGDGVDGYEVGDSVVVEPLMVDGDCPACLAGRYNACENMGFIGISGRGGGLSEHIVVEERWVHKIGDLPLDEAALIEPLAVALHGVKESGAKSGEVAVVAGAGPIGLLTASVLKAYGLSVIISEPSDARRSMAERANVADLIIDPGKEDLTQVVNEYTKNAGADRAFDCAGAGPLIPALLETLRAGGRLEVVALHSRPVELDITPQLQMQELSIGAAMGYANNHEEAISLARDGKVNLKQFITSRIDLDDLVEKGLKRLAGEGQTEVKILVAL